MRNINKDIYWTLYCFRRGLERELDSQITYIFCEDVGTRLFVHLDNEVGKNLDTTIRFHQYHHMYENPFNY